MSSLNLTPRTIAYLLILYLQSTYLKIANLIQILYIVCRALGYISNFFSMIELLHEFKKSFFKHGSIQEVDNVSTGKNEN